MVTEVSEENFLDEVLNSEVLTVIDFGASWCAPCLPMGRIIDKLSKEYGDRVKFFKVDVYRNSALADKLNIKSVPTLLFFSNGEIEAQVGLVSEEKVKSKIEKVLGR